MLEHGFRLPPPPGCLSSLYSLMIQSWWVHSYHYHKHMQFTAIIIILSLDCYCNHRHPEASHRPSFSDLLHSLKKMNLKEEDGGYDQLLHLGAPLELGKNLYPDLQNLYIEQCSSENKQWDISALYISSNVIASSCYAFIAKPGLVKIHLWSVTMSSKKNSQAFNHVYKNLTMLILYSLWSEWLIHDWCTAVA